MAKRTTKRSAARAHRRAQRAAGMLAPGGQSNYGRKQDWLRSATARDANLGRLLAKENGTSYTAERRLFGFDIPSPKPWR